MSYNVENLFDCGHDSLKNDYDFSAEGFYHWTHHKYRTKLHRIAEVINAITFDSNSKSHSDSASISASTTTALAIVGLIEVENDHCLQDLLTFHLPHSRYPYQFIHYESRDERGVDVALLYDSTRLSRVCSYPIQIPLPVTERSTRDILYAQFCKTADSCTQHCQCMHVFVCHFPSQLGGSAETEQKREIAFHTLKHHTDSILAIDSTAIIIAMGDFNTAPAERLFPLENLMLKPLIKSELVDGTHQWRGQWTCLDQFFVSSTNKNAAITSVTAAHIFAPKWILERDDKFLGYKPKRTYIGPRYHDGYSDHLPIYIDIEF